VLSESAMTTQPSLVVLNAVVVHVPTVATLVRLQIWRVVGVLELMIASAACDWDMEVIRSVRLKRMEWIEGEVRVVERALSTGWGKGMLFIFCRFGLVSS